MGAALGSLFGKNPSLDCADPGPMLLLVVALLPARAAVTSSKYEVSGAVVLKDGKPMAFTGVNAMHVYGGGAGSLAGTGVSIVREFVGAVGHQPVYSAATGGYASYIDGEWLHPLEGILEHIV